MSIHPAQQPANKEQALWNAVGDLRREVRQLRESRVAAIQRASDFTVGPIGPFSSTTTLATLTFNLPDHDSRVFFLPWFKGTQSNNTSSWTMTLKDDVDQTTPFVLNTVTNTTAAEDYYPAAASSSPLSFYSVASGVFIPTTGDHTFTLACARSAGTATLTVANVRFYGFVL